MSMEKYAVVKDEKEKTAQTRAREEIKEGQKRSSSKPPPGVGKK